MFGGFNLLLFQTIHAFKRLEGTRRKTWLHFHPNRSSSFSFLPSFSSGYDYRPFFLNWCMSVKIIDGYVVNPIESLKAEWLYSQGKGRSFRVGDQQALAQYLSQTCPLTAETLESENERKLRLILSKAQQHQRQLQEQIVHGSGSSATTPNNSPSSNRRKGPSRIQSPRGEFWIFPLISLNFLRFSESVEWAPSAFHS
jgi:hypothetical protein